MAIFRSLKTIIKKNPSSKTFLTTTTCTISAPYSPLSYCPSQTLSPFGYHSTRLLSPLSKLIFPFHGPLFLSFPPWKLSQSATPLYVQGNGIILRRVEAFNSRLNLLRKTKLPLRIRFGSVSPAPHLLDRLNSEKRNDHWVHGFVNLPNLISLSRLISGPFLGWMISNGRYSSAMVGLAISGATDWLDGYTARKMGINSVVGSYLDPLADKVLIGCVALAMVQNDLLHRKCSTPFNLMLSDSWIPVGLLSSLSVGYSSTFYYWRRSLFIGFKFSCFKSPSYLIH
uniref:Cardiolipin synthase (CMP-forming), mitochondrial n=1 Tax=Cucumis melo TaxID=3656 RepID=A0A9I9CRE6_CUCME